MPNRLILFVIMSIIPFVTTAGENSAINATLSYGADTNPHELSRQVQQGDLADVGEETEEIGDFYYLAELKINTDFFDLLHFDARAVQSQFIDDRRADVFQAYANIALKSGFNIFEQAFEYELSANFNQLDKTYVSKRTGLVAAFNGLSIADRYDYEQIGYFTELSYRPYRTLNLLASFHSEEKLYEQFEIVGLDNIDHIDSGFLFGMEYLSSEKGSFYLNANIEQKEYLDRRAKDIDGFDIVDTDLIFDYVNVNIGYLYRPNEKLDWIYTYNYSVRTDNASGFFDATISYIEMSGRYQMGDYHFITGGLKYSEFIFENQVDFELNILDEDAEERRGGNIKLGYEWIVATLFDTNFAIYFDLEHSTFTNSAIQYNFERNKASVGLRWSAF